MLKKLCIVASVLVFVSCNQESKKTADAIFINANVYTVDADFKKASAFAIQDGKFIAVGTSDAIQKEYQSDSIIDLEGKTVLPGLIDAHCHF